MSARRIVSAASILLLAIPSPSTRRAANASASAETASSQCRSSMATSTDPSAARDRRVFDISDVPNGGEAYPVAEGTWNYLYPPTSTLEVHSMWPSYDGTRTHLAYTAGFYLMLDTSELAAGDLPEGEVLSLNDNLLTPVENRPMWENARPGHSAVPFPGRPYVFETDEVYGTYFVPSYGCPWGWSLILDVADPAHPTVISEYRIRENTQEFCESPENTPETNHVNTYTAHNPTLTRNVAFVTWSNGGLQAVDIKDPADPKQAGWYSPTPIPDVANEDPATTAGPNKVMMWSFPIISDGLIYVTDIRNGLYILRYTGSRSEVVDEIRFLEGNSNLGEAGNLDVYVPEIEDDCANGGWMEYSKPSFRNEAECIFYVETKSSRRG